MNINWYPGHMKKTKEEIKNSLKLVDIVLEVIDARIPKSSRNPLISEITEKKDRIIIMNKTDLSDPVENEKWIKKFADDGIKAIKMNAKEKINTKEIYNIAKEILSEKFKKNEEKNIENENIRMMVVGIPNSGKSTFINNIAKRKGARVGNRPGVTQQKQWIKTKENILLLDTPGVLWPKFDGQTGLNLSFTNAIKDEILNIEELCLKFIEFMKEFYPKNLEERYKIDSNKTALEIYEEIGIKRGAIIRKGEVDYTRCANLIFNDFRSGKLGRITIEKA
ncbi:MAG: ribosome biogenesis GTPase YlqF [Anaerococcus vaginalis]|uniref:Ribosome biogenesis GTPase A n=1 Tax=Anaerococcus vaginalis TaxID=33037 RepID=A0A6N2QTZ4_9FIRM|nr:MULTISPECIES: ribosome biogenesis GTPase YlqF [Anaerococcus]MDU1763217.1 ribosome biogenesis GTPase YlqF [Anaerococcus vaginalis]MDU4378551.1 ribosome biogenesis GTPase YlqF [Anaerococcus vaginalis]MDU5342298.1 ribosome biogenesis GTPase YlqF [Anaerococcus vaginalis]MDU5461586.1 ribosome biogenesis GTPase YlqF [Anaerococcus vaginalis]MDU5824158.1 ribosome biogenesis GTPase YlqF [Anaerococcus vaginalis]